MRDNSNTPNDVYKKTELINHKPTPNHIVNMSDEPEESISKTHIHQTAVASPQNTYVREKFQNEGNFQTIYF